MQIRKTSGLQQSSAVKLNTNNRTAAAGANSSALPVDQLDISVEAQALTNTSNIRMDRVNEIKAQIASGIYETPEKIDQAVSRMLDEMG